MSQLQQRLTGVSIPLGVSQERWSEWLLRLRRRFRRRHNPAGMPDFLMLLASCLRGGAGYAESLEWIRARSNGDLRAELDSMLSYFEVGDTVANALLRFESKSQVPDLKEVALKLALADQLGSPVVSALEAMTDSSSATNDAALIAIGTKRENQMLYPLVFLVLPVTVLFVVFPSLQFLQLANL
ncbi:MAG: hypothetical protein RLZZ400_869 [Actinomycetota bacterium]